MTIADSMIAALRFGSTTSERPAACVRHPWRERFVRSRSINRQDLTEAVTAVADGEQRNVVGWSGLFPAFGYSLSRLSGRERPLELVWSD